MNTSTRQFMILAALSISSTAIAGDLASPLASTAYRTNKELAAEADRHFARAMEIFDSQLKVGTSKEFHSELDRAAILGHEDAAGFLCTYFSNEMLGIAHHRQSYFWCRVALEYFSGKDEKKEKSAAAGLAAVTKSLGPQNIGRGKEFEAFMLQRMTAEAQPKAAEPAQE